MHCAILILRAQQLIEELGRWGRDMNLLDAHAERRTPAAYAGLNKRGGELARRVQAEVGDALRVEYHPW